MSVAVEIPPSDTSMLIDKRELARMLHLRWTNISPLLRRGCLPTPIRLGGCNRWRRDEVVRWIAQGCPRGEPPPWIRKPIRSQPQP